MAFISTCPLLTVFNFVQICHIRLAHKVTQNKSQMCRTQEEQKLTFTASFSASIEKAISISNNELKPILAEVLSDISMSKDAVSHSLYCRSNHEKHEDKYPDLLNLVNVL